MRPRLRRTARVRGGKGFTAWLDLMYFRHKLTRVGCQPAQGAQGVVSAWNSYHYR